MNCQSQFYYYGNNASHHCQEMLTYPSPSSVKAFDPENKGLLSVIGFVKISAAAEEDMRNHFFPLLELLLQQSIKETSNC